MNCREQKNFLFAYVMANPVLLSRLYRNMAEKEPICARGVRQKVLEFNHFDPFLVHIPAKGCCKALPLLEQLYPDTFLKKEQVLHLFPVWSPNLETGLLVPVSITPAEEWQGTAIFTSFIDRTTEESPFSTFLQLIEKRWAKLHNGEQLPLRWRSAFSFRLRCPIHMGAVGGHSLQVPLLLMVLRELASGLDTLAAPAEFPLGAQPVFSTGALSHDGNTFLPVFHVPAKARAFLREYGRGLPAVLTTRQQEELSASDLLHDFEPIIIADCLDDLLEHAEIRPGLSRFAEPPHQTLVDNLLQAMSRSSRSIRFADAAGIADWLLPGVQSPLYQFRIRRQTAILHAHQGKFREMLPDLEHCRQLLEQHADLFGVNDRCDLATTGLVFGEDAADPEPALTLLESLRPHLHALSLEKRVAWWGSQCQARRMTGDLDEAVRAGNEAVKLADLGRASDSGRDRNYLIHALLDRARFGCDDKRKTDDLQQAQILLDQSEGEWAPRDNERNRRSHLTFCLHYRAEIARLRQIPFDLPEQPPWQGTWGHAWSFALLSCARNRAFDAEQRLEYAARAAAAVDGSHAASLFFMLLQVYQIYADALAGKSCAEPSARLQQWYTNLAAEGFPGWQRRIAPILEKMPQDQLETAELLCNSIPYL